MLCTHKESSLSPGHCSHAVWLNRPMQSRQKLYSHNHKLIIIKRGNCVLQIWTLVCGAIAEVVESKIKYSVQEENRSHANWIPLFFCDWVRLNRTIEILLKFLCGFVLFIIIFFLQYFRMPFYPTNVFSSSALRARSQISRRTLFKRMLNGGT